MTKHEQVMHYNGFKWISDESERNRIGEIYHTCWIYGCAYKTKGAFKMKKHKRASHDAKIELKIDGKQG